MRKTFVWNLRFAKHLEKCRRSYAGTDMQKCRFNISHHIPAPEIQHHELTCSDRLFVEKFLQGAAKRKAVPKDDQNNSKKAKLVDTDDEWDDVSLIRVFSWFFLTGIVTLEQRSTTSSQADRSKEICRRVNRLHSPSSTCDKVSKESG